MNVVQKINTFLQGQTKKQRLGLVIGLSFIIFMTAILSWWSWSTHYAVLFNHLEAEDARHIVQQLEHDAIPYRLEHQGQEVLIDKNLIDKTRLQVMGQDLQLSNSVGFELFDKSDFGLSDFSQKINFQRALQGELERTITSLEAVRQARVHLVIPDNHLFQSTENTPRAAVTLHLNRPLTLKQINSIQQLIAASVAHLPKDQVVIVDAQGNALTQANADDSDDRFSQKKIAERYLSNKVNMLLQRIFPHQQVVVNIDASFNYDQMQRVRSQPQQQGVISHEKETEHKSHIKDAKSNNEDITREKTYVLGEEKEQFTQQTGRIERLTISVAVPENTSTDSILQIERLIQSVVGFNGQRGDRISVEAVLPLIEAQTEAVLPSIITSIAPTSSLASMDILIYGLISVTGMAVIAMAYRRRQNQRRRRQLLVEFNHWLEHHDPAI